MKKKIASIIIAGVVVSIATVLIYFVSQEIQKPHDEGFEWITSGPFSVQNYQHRLGENIFIVAYGIAPDEKGVIRIFTPKNIEYISYQFDGSIKSQFNVYFKPDTFARKDRCSPEDFVGMWTMKFEGVSYPPIQFEFINEYIEGAEADIIDLCEHVT
ncbi:MAG: hypothetical protein ACT4OW_05375 [Nitrososphaerota archaeon]